MFRSYMCCKSLRAYKGQPAYFAYITVGQLR
jgi:hypothetical protein